jgi:ribosomal protein S18 acetylase RimI-like enzyme
MSKIEIRPYDPRTDFSGLKTTLTEAGMYDSDYESEDRLREYVADHPENVMVAAKADEIVGTIYLQDSDIIPMINRLTVRESERRQGIGSKLVRAAEKTAYVHGKKFLEVYVDIDNEDAQLFWEAQGYKAGHMYQNRSKKLSF